MTEIGYGYGSEWHLLRYLGYHRNNLSEKVLGLVGPGTIEWIDFNFSDKNEPLNRDQELKGLEFFSGNEEVMDKWKSFWPQTGNAQNWDAIGRIDYGDHKEWLLVEAKAHIGEIISSCGASEESKAIIRSALEKTQAAFGSNQPVKNWMNQYYQYANRLAMIYFLMKECDQPVKARLLFIYFYGDQREKVKCPQNEMEWRESITRIHNSLGINENSELMARVHHLYLSTNPKVV